jgi:hypothetical protein
MGTLEPETLKAGKRKPSAVSAKESTHNDHANQAVVRGLIPPTPRHCSFVPSVTTLLYRTIVPSGYVNRYENPFCIARNQLLRNAAQTIRQQDKSA